MEVSDMAKEEMIKISVEEFGKGYTAKVMLHTVL